jgi:hypothetical protein
MIVIREQEVAVFLNKFGGTLVTITLAAVVRTEQNQHKIGRGGRCIVPFGRIIVEEGEGIVSVFSKRLATVSTLDPYTTNGSDSSVSIEQISELTSPAQRCIAYLTPEVVGVEAGRVVWVAVDAKACSIAVPHKVNVEGAGRGRGGWSGRLEGGEDNRVHVIGGVNVLRDAKDINPGCGTRGGGGGSE